MAFLFKSDMPPELRDMLLDKCSDLICQTIVEAGIAETEYTGVSPDGEASFKIPGWLQWILSFRLEGGDGVDGEAITAAKNQYFHTAILGRVFLKDREEKNRTNCRDKK